MPLNDLLKPGNGPSLTADSLGGVTRRRSGQVRPGRSWYTDFSNSTLDALWLDVTNFTYGTDGATPIVSLTTPGTVGSILTKITDLRNVDIRLRLRAVAGSGFGIQDIAPKLAARYLDTSNYWYCQPWFSAANAQVAPVSVSGGDSVFGVGGDLTHDVSDTATYRWYRFRVLEDAVFSKWWFDGAAEPASWDIIDRLRPPLGPAGASASVDNTTFGKCGLTLQYGGYVTDLSITELVRSDDELLWNGDLGYGVDTRDGLPLFWYKNPGTPDAGNSYSTPTATDRFGVSRTAMRVDAATGEDLLWTQDLWTPLGGANAFLTRKRPMPTANPPAVIEVEVESSAVGVAHATTGLGALVVVYLYDQEGTVLNSGDNYGTLGPDGVVGSASPTTGVGTWSNYVNRFRLVLTDGTPPERIRFQVGLHDSNVTGQLTIHDISARPVT